MTPAASSPLRTAHTLRSAEHLVGWPVEDSLGHVLGTVRQLLFDLQTGRLACAVVASGGFMGQGEAHFTLAWEGLEPMDVLERFVWHGPAPSEAGATGWQRGGNRRR